MQIIPPFLLSICLFSLMFTDSNGYSVGVGKEGRILFGGRDNRERGKRSDGLAPVSFELLGLSLNSSDKWSRNEN